MMDICVHAESVTAVTHRVKVVSSISHFPVFVKFLLEEAH
jgi:hypothetical protein